MCIRGQISFLTKIPLGNYPIETLAKHSYFFPIVGLIIGGIVSFLGYIYLKFLPLEIAVGIIILSAYAITGLIHLDGLADFSDGVMAAGGAKRKIAAMKDARVGIAGVVAVVFVLILAFYSIKLLVTHSTDKSVFGFRIPMYSFGAAMVISEIAAKLSLNTCITFGNKLNGGIGAVFISHATYPKFGIALLLSLIFSALIAGWLSIVVLFGVVVGLFIVQIANLNFGGVTGDAMGAADEIAKVVTLVVLAVIS